MFEDMWQSSRIVDWSSEVYRKHIVAIVPINMQVLRMKFLVMQQIRRHIELGIKFRIGALEAIVCGADVDFCTFWSGRCFLLSWFLCSNHWMISYRCILRWYSCYQAEINKSHLLNEKLHDLSIKCDKFNCATYRAVFPHTDNRRIFKRMLFYQIFTNKFLID